MAALAVGASGALATEHVGQSQTVDPTPDRSVALDGDRGPLSHAAPEPTGDVTAETTGDAGATIGHATDADAIDGFVHESGDRYGWDVSLDPEHDGARFVVSGCETRIADASDRDEAIGTPSRDWSHERRTRTTREDRRGGG